MRVTLVFVVFSAAIGVGFTPASVTASAHPSCSSTRIVRTGSMRMFESPVTGGYTRFVSDGGGMYGVDPNSLPEELSNRLKPNGPPVAAEIVGRVCAEKIFYIERVLKPVITSLRPYE